MPLHSWVPSSCRITCSCIQLLFSRRKIPQSVNGINSACRYFLMESGFALFVAFLINIAVISVSGTVCSSNNLSQENADQCSDLTLHSATFLLNGHKQTDFMTREDNINL